MSAEKRRLVVFPGAEESGLFWPNRGSKNAGMSMITMANDLQLRMNFLESGFKRRSNAVSGKGFKTHQAIMLDG
jgi:hypothetical protein